MNVCNSICVFPCELQNSITQHRHFFILGGCVYGINEDVFAKRQFCFSSVRLDFDISAKKKKKKQHKEHSCLSWDTRQTKQLEVRANF